MIEKDVVTLTVFYFYCYNVLEDLRMMTDNLYVFRFINLFER
jgi:hypothetical protein